jgi:hypothetical protein
MSEAVSTQARLFAPALAPTETNVEAMLEYAADLRRKRAQGGRLTPVEWKIVERCAFLEVQGVTWSDRAALAGEIKQLCGLTYNALDKAKCPWNAHGPTEKYPVMRWLVERLATDAARLRRESIEARGEGKLDKARRAAELRRKQAQAEREETDLNKARRRYEDQAEDAARRLVVDLCTSIRRALIDEAPTALAALLHDLPPAVREATIRAHLTAAMDRAMAADGAAPLPGTPP